MISVTPSCERRPSYTAPTKAPSPLRHATSYSRSSSSSSSSTESSDSASSSCRRTESNKMRFDLASDVVTATKMNRIHLLPILKRSDNKTLVQSNVQSSIQISIHTSESGTRTSLCSTSESSGGSMEEVKKRSSPRPRCSKEVMSSWKAKKIKGNKGLATGNKGFATGNKGLATVNGRASIPERQRQRHVSFLPPGTSPGPKNPTELHSLFTYSPVHKFARFLDIPTPASSALSLAYDVSLPPCPYSLIISRQNGLPLRPNAISATLAEPATVPPTTSQLLLTSTKFPWEVIASSSSLSTSSSNPNASSVSIAILRHITNLDILHAIHVTLATPVLPDEWALLDASQKKRVLKAYERRCISSDGGWDEGVRRVDYLCGKTLLVGIDFVRIKEKDGVEPSVKGKIIFARPPPLL